MLKCFLAHEPQTLFLTSSVIYYRKDLLKAQRNLIFCLIQGTELKSANLPRSTLAVAECSQCNLLPSLGIFPVTNAALLSFFFLILVNSFLKTFISPCSLARQSDDNCFEVRFCCHWFFVFNCF